MAKIDLPKRQTLFTITDEMRRTRILPENFCGLLYVEGKIRTERNEYLVPVYDPYEEEEYGKEEIAQGEVEEKNPLGAYAHHVTYDYYLPLRGDLTEVRERLNSLLLYAVDNPHRNLCLLELCRKGRNPHIAPEDIADMFVDALALKNLFLSESLWKAVKKIAK